MLTKEEMAIIDQYVNDDYYDKDRLLKYLNMHTVVGNEIFGYCDRRELNQGMQTYAEQLDSERGYTPLSVSAFVKRIPFYFYAKKIVNGRFGRLDFILPSLSDPEEGLSSLDELYEGLEYLFYEKHFDLEAVFCYPMDQSEAYRTRDLFRKWVHYIHLCDEQGTDDYMPDCFIALYNEALDKAGLEPIIYEISESGLGDPYWRTGMKLEFEGTFPYDAEGNPIMKWIGMETKDAGAITCTKNKSKPHGRLWIELTPKTVVRVLNFYNDKDEKEDYWYQVYAGPQTMEFNYSALKLNRKLLKLTQQQVADAVGANLRTYQKWESGETIPDGHYLLRLLNWLDIRDVQFAVKYNSAWD